MEKGLVGLIIFFIFIFGLTGGSIILGWVGAFLAHRFAKLRRFLEKTAPFLTLPLLVICGLLIMVQTWAWVGLAGAYIWMVLILSSFTYEEQIEKLDKLSQQKEKERFHFFDLPKQNP